ncbi:MAG: hypothetical protein ACI4VF_04380 [Lachnospirales bacterium]
MKNDLAVYEIKHLLKKFEKQNLIKTIVLVGVGFALVVICTILIVSKLKKKEEPISYDGLDFEDWDDLDDMDYDEYDFDEDAEDMDFDFAEEETDNI